MPGQSTRYLDSREFRSLRYRKVPIDVCTVNNLKSCDFSYHLAEALPFFKGTYSAASETRTIRRYP